MNYNSIKTELSDDLISRNAVLKEISCWIGSGEYRYAMSERFLIDRLIDLPPVTPQEPKTNKENIHREREQAYMQGYEDACKKYRQEPKTGHWESFDLTYGRDIYKCSVCKCATNVPTVLGIPMFKYCPNCGAKMIEPQDCRDCKEYEDCPCGKDGHESGTSQGYSIGECSEFELETGDLISRQAVLDAFGLSEKTRKYGGDHSGYDTMMFYEIQDIIESLPSAEPKTGHSDTFINKPCISIGVCHEDKVKVLDKIRAEIEQMNNLDYVEPVTVDEVLLIIDKYRESEDLGDYPDTIPYQFDNMTGSMNL